jgi:alpha-1,6-mannosyltransferase
MIDPGVHTLQVPRSAIPVWIAGGSLVAYAALLCALSFGLGADALSREHALAWLAGGGVVAGALYLIGMYRARCLRIAPGWIIVIAIAARLVVSAAPPMLESDYQRYLWDGAVTAHGINPYRHAPGDVVAGPVEGSDRGQVTDLAARAGHVLTSVNHPHLTTIYPPVAQGAFAAAYAVAPFSPLGLRVVFVLADAVTLILLSRLLRALSLSPVQLAWYAWNPLLLREVYSSLHMDVLLLPLIAASLLAAIRAQVTVASAWLVVASAVKVWPIALLPMMLRPLVGRWRRLAVAILVAGLLGAVLWLPVFLASHGENSGFLAYGKGWQNNDGFFRAGIWLTERALDIIGFQPWHSHSIMRIVSAVLVGSVVIWQSRTPSAGGRDLVNRCLWIVGAILVLSPTQFPWYWMWCLPFLTLRPFLPLLLYVALLPLYYVQDQLIYPLSHWLQHAPVWVLLGVAGARCLVSHRRSATELEVRRA